MPRLPDITNLSATPPQSVRQAVDIPVPDIAGAAATVARGLENVGNAAANFGQQYAERARRQERFDTKMGLLKAEEAYAEKVRDLDPLDPGYVEKKKAVRRETFAPVLSKVKDPENRQRFEEETLTDYTNIGIRAGEEQRQAFGRKAKLDAETLTEAQRRRIRNGEDPAKVIGETTDAIDDNQYLDGISKEETKRKASELLTWDAVETNAMNRRGKVSGGAVVRAVVQAESSGDPTAVSPKGAIGLMQVMPGTAAEIAAELGDEQFFKLSKADQRSYLQDPNVSLRYGAHYLDKMLKRYGGDLEAALVAYNAGPGNADKWVKAGRNYAALPKPEETGPYVQKIFKTLGVDAGTAASDPRLFATREDIISSIEQDPLFRQLPVDMADKLRAGVDGTLKAEEDAQFKQFRDSLDLGIEQGTVTRDTIESAPLEDKDKAVLLRRFDERNKDAISAADFATRLTEGTVNPKAPEDRKMAGKLLEAAGGGRAIVEGEPTGVAALYDLFDQTGIVPDNAKGAFEAMLRSKDRAKVTTALSYLAELDRRNHRAFQQEFDESTEGLVQQYKDSLDYATPEQAANQVMQALDPNTEAIRRERSKVAEQAASKFTLGDVKNNFDPSYFPFTEPDLTLAKDAEAQLMLDYRKLYVEAYKQTGNETQAQKIAAGQLTRMWGASSANSGTIMKWPPEALYGTAAMVNGSFEWMGQEIEDLLKARGYERTFAAPVTDALGNVVGTTEEVSVAPHFLLADAQTLAEHQSGKPPSYQVWILDETGSYDVVPGRVYFDPAAARKRMQPQLEADRQENLRRRQQSEAELARQRLEGVAPIPGGDPLLGTGGAGLAPADLNEKIGAP